ncbi:MAG: serine/threonine protein kinase [Chitinophagaceae bacterium]|nr:serine/threonine protein kinase [Chitinophagaceae bacterium]
MIGQKIHSYEITAHLGKGGMGNVYKATDTMLGRDVALKMLHPQLIMESQFLERFKKEARVLAQLLHPNIAVIYNFIEQENNHYMVMEYVQGDSLDDLMKKHRTLSPEFIVPVFTQVLEGLQHAHQKNIYHRDIKPANIMLTADGTVKLMDFGIAKVAGEQKMTQVNKIVGTVEFMAPELIQGKDASAASDIYAAGVTMYELLSGKLPFEADTDFTLMQAILKQKITHPVKFNAAIPRSLSDIIMKALDKNPANRFANARAFQQALQTAFPNYRNISLVTLNPVGAAYGQSTIPSTRMLDDNNAGLQTRAEVWSGTATFFDKLKASFNQYKVRYLIVALLFLFLFVVVLVKNSGTPDQPEANNGGGNEQDTEMAGNNNGGGVQIQPVVPVQPAENKEVVPSPENKKEPEKEKNKKEEKVIPVVVAPEPEEKEKPVVKKDIVVSSKVEIDLYLQNDLSNAPERQDIPVTFSLNRAVIYGGVTIVEKGAVARGVIKLGKIQTDVDINTITAANGQTIRIKAERGHGRRNEITSARNYTAIILPGTRINF